MSRRGWLGVGGVFVAALVVGLVLLRSHDRSAGLDDRAARADESNDLEIKLARLQGKLAALEARVSTPPPTQEGASAVAAPAPAPDPTPPPRRRTREEQTAIFEGYFDRLDTLRGTRDDGTLTKQFAGSLAAVNPEHKSLHGAKVDSVACGNGLCRVELTFASANDLDMGKTELQFQIGPLSGATTMYVDPERNHLFAYFAAPGTELPPFPRD